MLISDGTRVLSWVKWVQVQERIISGATKDLYLDNFEHKGSRVLVSRMDVVTGVQGPAKNT